MMKEIGVQGRQVKLYSEDGGLTWSSSPQAIIAYGQRKKKLRLELQRSFAEIDEKRDLDSDNFTECETTKDVTTATEKVHAPSIGKKIRRVRLGAQPFHHAVSGRAAKTLDATAKQVEVSEPQQFFRNKYSHGQRPRLQQLIR
jgi:hypothetical protein